MKMKQIRIAVADEDTYSLRQLTNYLVKNTQAFEVYSFAKKESFVRFLQEEQMDILLLTEEMRSEATDAAQAVVKCLLCEEKNDDVTGYEVIRKYQKTAALVGDIMLLYSKQSGKADVLARGERKTQLIGVYSPVGGSGKTAIALLLAQQLVRDRKKVFYQNWEGIDSTQGVLAPEAQVCLSDLLVSIRAGEHGVGVAVLSKMCTPVHSGFSYINPRESSLELSEVSLTEQTALIREIVQLGQFDYVLLDFDSEMNESKLALLALCDRIVVPFLPDPVSLNKFLRFLQEMTLREQLRQLSDRMVYVGNRMGKDAIPYLEQKGVYQKCTPAVLLPVSQTMANPGLVLANGSAGEPGIQSVAAQLLR